MSQLPLYKIRDWDAYFENAKSRTYDKCAYVVAPNKHGGSGWSNVMGEPDGGAIWGIWKMLVDLCSRQRKPREGWLTDNGKKNGRRLSARELSNQFRRPLDEIHRCLQVMQSPEVSFIELIEGRPEHISGIAHGYQQDTGGAGGEQPSDGQAEHTAVSPEYPQPVSAQDTLTKKVTKKERKGLSPEESQGNGDENPDEIQHAEAKRLITDLALAVFDRRLSEADWSNPEKDRWLDDALPIRRTDWAAVNWFYRLPADHEVFKTTARRQSAEAFLEHLKGEIDKAKTKRKELGLNGQFEHLGDEAHESDGWTVARAKAAVELFGGKQPGRFADLGASACRKVDEKIAAQKTEGAK